MEEEVKDKNGCCASGCCSKHAVIILIILGMVAVSIISIIRERIVNPMRYQVNFTAEGRVFAKPDIAQVSIAVKTERVVDSVQAVKNNTDKMNGVISKLKDSGIEEKDIKTTSYRLNPVYDYPNGRSVLTGYEVYQEVTIKIRDLNKIGKVIEAVTAVGANQVGNVAFTIDDPENIKTVARAEAVAKAKKRAEETAKLTGIKLGKLVNVYENEQPYPTPMYDSSYMARGIGGGGSAAPEIQTGENEIVVQMTLVYEVK
jgi:uncharacterized protein YggE